LAAGEVRLPVFIIFMSQRTLAFRQPRWRAPDQLLTRAVLLLLVTGVWCGLYAWLGYRLWQAGVWNGIGRNRPLLIVCIVLGVIIVLGWYMILRYWRTAVGTTSEWAPLTQEQLQSLDPAQFEAYVAQRIFARQGYYVHDTPHVKDGGIDILLEDRNGVQAIVQCKRYRNTVGEATVRELYGTMIHTGAAHAYLVTSGRISNEACAWAEGKPIDLIDGQRLEELAKALPARGTPLI
jgi:restriction system protein